MDLKNRNKLETSFSMASMTDIIFQLLIFFMLTSSFVNPAALPVNLPSSVEAPTITPKVQVTITSDLQYFVNDEPIEIKQLEAKIKDALRKSSEPVVVLNIDKDVPTGNTVKVASIVNKLKAKVSIATKVESEN
jgi:biopolymer transport protein ExbD